MSSYVEMFEIMVPVLHPSGDILQTIFKVEGGK